MGMLYYDYKFKKTEFQDKWDDFKNNIDKTIRFIYKDKSDIGPILSLYRKVYKITPASIKNNFDDKYKNDREFLIFVLLSYTSICESTISSEFDIKPKDLELLKQKYNQISEEYEEKISKLFEPLKDGYISNKYQQLAFQEEINIKQKRNYKC